MVKSGSSAAKIRTLDDCVTEKQKCVLYFTRVPDYATGISRWSIRTDDSMNLFRNESQNRFTVIAENAAGDISARLEFVLT